MCCVVYVYICAQKGRKERDGEKEKQDEKGTKRVGTYSGHIGLDIGLCALSPFALFLSFVCFLVTGVTQQSPKLYPMMPCILFM